MLRPRVVIPGCWLYQRSSSELEVITKQVIAESHETGRASCIRLSPPAWLLNLNNEYCFFSHHDFEEQSGVTVRDVQRLAGHPAYPEGIHVKDVPAAIRQLDEDEDLTE